ncbi:Eukaryotic peptide chain release factor subunit [Trichinella spiralis]|uniref:Eukaryotic peptide chain release factor subunit n=1 Tax=Trichinella spiralis TaxID=6334 RepID=A0ABR3K5P3_TRISP
MLVLPTKHGRSSRRAALSAHVRKERSGQRYRRTTALKIINEATCDIFVRPGSCCRRDSDDSLENVMYILGLENAARS